MIGPFKKRRRPFAYPGEEIRLPGSGPAPRAPREQNASSRGIETGRLRLLVTACLFLVAYSVVTGRLVQLMVLAPWAAEEPAQASAPDPVPLEVRMNRADIVDRNGLVLATNLPTVNLIADTRAVPEHDLQRAIRVLPTLFPEMSSEDLKTKLVPGKAFVYLRRNLTPVEQQAVNDLGIPGLHFERSERRVYPAGRLVAHVVGATDIDNRGIAGLEKSFDTALTSGQGALHLSLDLRLQHAAHQVLSDAITRFEAQGGAALVMDARTAEVLAMVSLPDYEPEKIGETTEDARFNRATLGVYELGSVFKVFNTAMAIDAGMRITESFDAANPIRISRFTITDFHPEGRWLTVPEILEHSSNIGSARMAMVVGTERQQEFLARMGLLEPLPFELPEVGRPLVPKVWREINTMTISFGHGLSVTPLHLITGVSALLNGGLYHAPTLLKTDPNAPPEGRRVFSEANSIRMRAMMRLVVEAGSGKSADIKGYYVGGKTGSAEKQLRGGGYAKDAVLTSFVAGFPITDPRYIVLVVLDDPKAVKGTYGFRTAGWNATPAAGKLIAEIAPILGVAPVYTSPAGAFDPTLIRQVGLKLDDATEDKHLAAR
ncbi:peptidoglycan D,D-transpeptidase FtsI family protein [Pararhodospirillum photometricum]|uniref:Peptidoglycan glycosyltransferase n=1 Tax=Pararhodospirillum photometricum DSM 122 TaxID=1150469 RepID=H6SNG2_PARPM|nr:penicillin-binding protein 2 [Pararhodospirillum photometricum]CCG09293.1 Peptidoglycan glycosyltransferase [Pararhodospirillum photometricum DSM 122]